MWNGDQNGGAVWRNFFYDELEQLLDLNSLYQEAYILIKEIGFSWSDIKSLTKTDRSIFLKLFKEDIDRQNDAIERSRTDR